MSDLPSAERRITLRLLAYWEKLRRDRSMPTEQDINPADIGDLWDCCFLVRASDLDKPDYNYTYLGKAIADAYHNGLSHVEEEGVLATPHACHLAENCTQVISSCKPLIDEGEFKNMHNETIRYRQCLLPLGEEGKVLAIFGGMRFKIFVSGA